MICGFRFGADGRGLSVGADEAVAWLAGTADAIGFVWLRFNLAHAATEKCLRANVALSELFHEALRDGSRSTRVERDDEMQVAVVSDVHYDFAFDRGDGPGPADQHHRWVIGDERGGVPLADHPQGLWIAVAVIVTFTVAAGWIALRRMRNR